MRPKRSKFYILNIQDNFHGDNFNSQRSPHPGALREEGRKEGGRKGKGGLGGREEGRKVGRK